MVCYLSIRGITAVFKTVCVCVCVCVCLSVLGGKGYLTPKRTDSPEAGASFHFLYLSTPASCCRRKWPRSTQPKWNWRECLHCYTEIVSAKNQPPDKLWMRVMERIRGGGGGGRQRRKGDIRCDVIVLSSVWLKQLESWEGDKWHTHTHTESHSHI